MAWQTADNLLMQSGANLINEGVFEFQESSTIAYNGGALPTFNNTATGTVQVAAGKTGSVGTIAFINNGGLLTADLGATLNFGGGNATFNAGTTFSGAGTLLVANNATFNGAFNASNLVLSGGIFSGGAAVLNGSVDWTGGSFNGDWEVAAGQTLNGKAAPTSS